MSQPKPDPRRRGFGSLATSEYGLLFPGEFIPLFEQNGKIQELDFYMFEETCKLLKTWLAEGRAMPCLSIFSVRT